MTPTPQRRAVARRPGRIVRENATVAAMIAIYCAAHHGSSSSLCNQCQRLRDYAERRLDNCPFYAAKPVCNKCTVHCYSAERRDEIRKVMRYAGPRMLLRHPWLALRHLLDTRLPALKLERKRSRRRGSRE